MAFTPPANPRNFCGRIHLGPICVNGGKNGQPICEWCGADVTSAERVQVQRQWDVVRAMLRPMREKKERR